VDVQRYTDACQSAAFYGEVRRGGGSCYIGLWKLPALVKKVCVGANCIKQIYGDTLFLRAIKPIKAGEELTISQRTMATYEQRADYNAIGEQCFCPLCIMELQEEDGEKKRRAELLALVESKDKKEIEAAIRQLEEMNRNPILKYYSFFLWDKLADLNLDDPDERYAKVLQQFRILTAMSYYEEAIPYGDMYTRYLLAKPEGRSKEREFDAWSPEYESVVRACYGPVERKDVYKIGQILLADSVVPIAQG